MNGYFSSSFHRFLQRSATGLSPLGPDHKMKQAGMPVLLYVKETVIGGADGAGDVAGDG